jgi:hypothetical protein
MHAVTCRPRRHRLYRASVASISASTWSRCLRVMSHVNPAYHPVRGSRDSLAFAIVRHVEPGERLRRSASRRFAEQIEWMAQGVAQRVIELVVDALDVNALLVRVDLNAVLARVDLNGLLGRVDLNQVIDRVDLNQVIDRVDLNQVIDRVDVNRLMARVDINELAGRVDIEALVKNTDLGALLASSSGTIATEAVDMGRSHAVSMDDTLARWVSRLRRNHTGRAGPPELLNAQEEP